MTDSPLAFRIRPIRILSQRPTIPNDSENKTPAAKLILETPSNRSDPKKETAPTVTPPPSPSDPVIKPSPRLSSLSKIRGQFAQTNQTSETEKTITFELDTLTQAWSLYAEELRTTKNPALPSFERATLEMAGPTEFLVKTHNNIEQRFIEQERNPLYEFLVKKLKVPSLQFQVVLGEPDPQSQDIITPTLSSRDQYLALSEKYPLIETLKEKLGLDLDY